MTSSLLEKIAIVEQAVIIRKDILDLEKHELDDLVRAWKGIQELPLTIPIPSSTSPATMASPSAALAIRARTSGKALQRVSGCEKVTLPFWNQMKTDGETVIPAVFLQKQYTTQDGETFKNPLYSYQFQQGFVDQLVGSSSTIRPIDYGKHKGYETVRFPYSGLVGKSNIAQTKQHNAEVDALGEVEVNRRLQNHVKGWLINETQPENSMRLKYLRCLDAPNYTVFSNTTSATKWNDDNFYSLHESDQRPTPNPGDLVVSLESPHNGMHLAVGGYNLPPTQKASDPQSGDDQAKDTGPSDDLANGDMGENDTAGFDPIFYFHHAFIDLVFWSWQKIHKATDKLEIQEAYPGTSTVDLQGPTPGMAAGAWLTADTPLDPFKFEETGKPLTSKDVTNTENLGYKYLDKDLLSPPQRGGFWGVPDDPMPTLRVPGINRANIAGSFVIAVWATGPGTEDKVLVGFEPVFSRWHVAGCPNCQNSLSVTAYIPLNEALRGRAKELKYDVELIVSDVEKGKQSQRKGRWSELPLDGGPPGLGLKIDLGEYYA
ncbi:Tyrosinase [Cladobotryum mycophilum]|uniref:tyrosinase n=1 Tax=Cladobotryum mycophilum TaxID=491253 RepID=A0ABR0SB51_9HYPO